VVRRKIEFTDASPSDAGDWMLVRAQGLKDHYVHKCIFSNLVASLESYGYPVIDSVQTKAARHEEPCLLNVDGRPEEHVKIDVLSITIPSRDVEVAMNRLISLPIGKFKGGQEYFRLNSTQTCIILTPEQRSAFCSALASLVDRAKSRDSKFFENLKREQDDDTD